MAIKARSFKDARSQAKSNPELVWWVFMRLSGMALVVLTMFHLFKNYIIVSELEWDWASVVGKYGEVTDFGKFMDPLVDKFLTSAAFICFVSVSRCSCC